MFSDTNILLYILLMPVIGAFFAFIFRENTEQKKKIIKLFSLFFSFLTLLLVFSVYLDISSFESGDQFLYQIKTPWFERYKINFHLGVDSVSILFILLTSFLIFASFVYSYFSVKESVRNYFMLFFLLQFLVIGSFMALDLFLFYIFFESSLMPMFFIIAVWGDKDRIYAGYKFFLYTLSGSVVLLMVIGYIYLNFKTLNIIELKQLLPKQALDVQKWLWMGMFLSFAVKTPMWPLHVWLPDAHVQAPTAGSMILAGVLLKMGGYGFIRFSIPMLPQASEFFQSFVFALSIIAIIYASFVAFAQDNMKKLIAYLSIAHMGYVTLGLFSPNIYGMTGAMFQMISHGLVSAALFLSVGILSDITGTKNISDYGGIAGKMPFFATVLMIFVLSAIGIPGTSGFIGEFFSLLGAYHVQGYTVLAATGIVLSTVYMLLFYKRVMLGKFKLSFDVGEKVDLSINIKLKILLFSFAFLIILLGICPMIVTDVISANISNIVMHIKSYGF